jgi:hypothetical protein
MDYKHVCVFVSVLILNIDHRRSIFTWILLYSWGHLCASYKKSTNWLINKLSGLQSRWRHIRLALVGKPYAYIIVAVFPSEEGNDGNIYILWSFVCCSAFLFFIWLIFSVWHICKRVNIFFRKLWSCITLQLNFFFQ